MVGLIYFLHNDYILALVYLLIILFLFLIHRERNELIILLFGFIFMIFSEYFFVKTGAEIFVRKSLFGIMPIWLPLLWGYGFVVIKRCVYFLDK